MVMMFDMTVGIPFTLNLAVTLPMNCCCLSGLVPNREKGRASRRGWQVVTRKYEGKRERKGGMETERIEGLRRERKREGGGRGGERVGCWSDSSWRSEQRE